MRQIFIIAVAAWVVVAGPVVPWHTPSLAKDVGRLKVPNTIVVDTRIPTVLVFAPPQWERDSRTDEGTREVLAHVRFAVDDVNRCKGDAQVAVRMVFADRLVATAGGRRTAIDLSRKFPDSAGAYLFRPGRKPCSIATSGDTAALGDILSQAVGEFFEVPACFQKGMSNVCRGSAG